MPDERRHRGPHPEDQAFFAEGQVPVLRSATRDLSWLLARGYAGVSSLKLVGDRYGLTARQRTAVSRCACTPEQRDRRQRNCRTPQDIAKQSLWIDGYNVLTSIEAALSGGVLIRGLDGCLRDMASMHGSYRKVDETVPAITLLGQQLADWEIGPCRWFIDQPVSNSGRLRSILLDVARQHGWTWEVHLVPDPDPILATADVCVATADSEILNQTRGWLNLVDLVVRGKLPQAWVIDVAVADDDPQRPASLREFLERRSMPSSLLRENGK
jgi:hypothetical protein